MKSIAKVGKKYINVSAMEFVVLIESKLKTNIVIVITQYERDAGFQGLRPFVFMPSEKYMEKSFAVSEIMLIFAPLKYMRYVDAAILGGICCICYLL